MVRRKGTSRVGGADSGSGAVNQPAATQTFPSLRQRRPVMYWVVMLAVLAMVLSTIASFVSAFV